MSPKEHTIVLWLATGDRGLSSDTLAYCALGMEEFTINHPHDPSDFMRCLLLVSMVPSICEAFSAVAALSPQWNQIIDNWAELETTLIEEVGMDWESGRRAPRTYQLMQGFLSQRERDK